jgi:aldose 1-epimerase
MPVTIHNNFAKIDGNNIALIQLAHSKGCKASISSYGAIILKFEIVTANNTLQDIVLGFDTIEEYIGEDYIKDYPYFGAIIGRHANRIKGASFKLNDVDFNLAKNLGEDNLHSGPNGFDKKIWQIIEYGNIQENPFVKLQYTSKDGDSNFPNEVITTVTYTLKHNELITQIDAISNGATIFNPTQHTYFNLNNNMESIENHVVQIEANYYLEQDADFCVTGNCMEVGNTPLNFQVLKKINKDWNAAQGYDQSFVIKNDSVLLKESATAIANNLELKVYTTAPIVHFYTGRWIPTVIGKNGHKYGKYSGLCFETQYHPNGINIPQFPNNVIDIEKPYAQTIIYKISIKY